MKVIIAGGRYFQGALFLEKAIKQAGFRITEVVSGACLVSSKNPAISASGADGLGEYWAKRNGIPVTRFYADLYGKWPSCGPRRNRAMAEYVATTDPDGGGLICLPGNRGTANMLAEAQRLNLAVFNASLPAKEPESNA